MEEVKQHQLDGSMWTVLKGRVYNISPYMKFHPGGNPPYIHFLDMFFLVKHVISLVISFTPIRLTNAHEDLYGLS